jgi:toluene monooxygenase system protein E
MEVRSIVTGQRSYWHLEARGRVPQPYDIATSQLLYHTELGFALPTPAGRWMQRYALESPLRGRLREFQDPRRTTYARYVELQAGREAFVEQLLQAAEQSGEDRALSSGWLDVLGAVLPVLRYPSHALHMLAAYVAHLAPEGRAVVAGAFQAGDELRRLQHWAYRMRQLQELRSGFGEAAREQWQSHPAWQPLRRVLERLLVTYDFGEAFAALQLVVKPAFDELYMVQFAALALERGDRLFAALAHALEADCDWHRAWSDELIRVALREDPGNLSPLRDWVARWWPPLQAALPPLIGLWGANSEQARQYLTSVETKCCARWGELGLGP